MKRYFGDSSEGYIYIHVENRDSEASYTEALNFVVFENLSLLAPQKGSAFEITVGPNSWKTVIVRQNDPYSLRMSSQFLK